ncbi:MAG: hypothetical protein UHI93_06145, partial [Acutalibacteraceae bacterium]|nr:hypothetical protein [Acutalibacteraceae bacterium]
MAEDVEALDLAVVGDFAPVRELGLGIDFSVPVMTVLLRMGFAVVDPGTGQGRVDFTGAVPGGAERTETRRTGLIALLLQPFGDAAGSAAEFGRERPAGSGRCRAEYRPAGTAC